MRKACLAIVALAWLVYLAPSVAQADLVAYLSFDGHTNDLTGNGNDGVFFGEAPGPIYVAGHDGTDPGAIQFDGLDDYLRVTQTLSLPLTNNVAFTVAMWVRGAVQSDKRVFSEGKSTDNNPLFNLGTHNTGANGRLNNFLRPGPGHRQTAATAFDGAWHHIAWVDNNGDVTVYIDGLRDTANLDYTRQLTGLDRTAIGAILRATPCCYFAGAIDEVRLYDHALSQAQVRALISRPGCPEAGDTHCSGIAEVSSPVGGGAGRWQFEVTANDDGGDPLFYEIEVFDPQGRSVSFTRGSTSTIDVFLGEGTWTIVATADDDAVCFDAAADATCVLEVTVDPEPLCVSHWSFDSTLEDSGPGGNDGSWVGGAESAPTYVAGFDGTAGGAIRFDGADDYVSFTQTSGLPIYANSAYTVTAWVKGLPQGDRRVFSEASAADANPLVNVGTDNTGTTGALDIFIRQGTTLVNHAKSARPAFDDTWHHVAWVDDNGRGTIYIDGVRDSTMPAYVKPPIFNYNTTTAGGILRATPCCWFAGCVDEMRVYNYALSEADVVAMVPEPKDCADDGDTRCLGLEADGPAGDIAGAWTLTASAADTTGDDPLWYTFELTGPDGSFRQIGPQTSNTTTTTLTTGAWSVSVCVDDFLLCRDEGGNACCTAEVLVRATPALRIGHWTFDRTLDDSEDGNDGTWNGANPPVYVRGWDCAPASALSFAGDTGNNPGDELVIVTQSIGLPLYTNEEFSIAMWVRGQRQVDKRVWAEGNSLGNNNPLYNLGTDNTGMTGALDFFLRDDAGVTVVAHVKSVQTVFDGTWHHICWIDNQGDVTLYVDGVADATNFDYTRPPLTLNTTTIGGILRGTTCCEFLGRIDDVQVFNYALPADEVAKLCGQTAPNCCPAEGDPDYADTHCDGLKVASAGPGGGAGVPATVPYLATAFASDGTDDAILYTFTASAAGVDPIVRGPQAESTASFDLTSGEWTVTVDVDDDPECPDLADDARCTAVIAVPPPCSTEGDTHCLDLDVAGDGAPGEYAATATAQDDSGDPILYTFTACHPKLDRPPVVVGPQVSNQATFTLDVDGDWNVSVVVDDDLDCEDVAPDAECRTVVPVRSGAGPFVRGNVDGIGSIELTDGVVIFNYLFLGGPAPPCLAAANTNLQREINITSGVYLLNYLFLGGPEPPAPFPACGTSAHEFDLALGCERFPACP